jgi:hypothetical protein
VNLHPVKKVSNYNGGPITKASPYWYCWVVNSLLKHSSKRTVLYERLGRNKYEFSSVRFGLKVQLSLAGKILSVKFFEIKAIAKGDCVPAYKQLSEYTIPINTEDPSDTKDLALLCQMCCDHIAKDTYLADESFKKRLTSNSWTQGIDFISCLVKNVYIKDGDFYVDTRNPNLSTFSITHGLAPSVAVGSYILIDKKGKMHAVSAFDYNLFFSHA